MERSIETLGSKAADYAIQGAFAYLRKHHALTLGVVDRLSEHLRRCAKAALPVALADAKEALDAGMVDAAQATFRASMVNAGIAAAKTVHFVAE